MKDKAKRLLLDTKNKIYDGRATDTLGEVCKIIAEKEGCDKFLKDIHENIESSTVSYSSLSNGKNRKSSGYLKEFCKKERSGFSRGDNSLGALKKIKISTGEEFLLNTNTDTIDKKVVIDSIISFYKLDWTIEIIDEFGNIIKQDESINKKSPDVKIIENGLSPEIKKEITKQTPKIGLYQIVSSEIDWKKLSLYNNGNIEYEIAECEEYTYIMEDKAHATVKIGKTTNSPTLRLNQLKTGNPSIELLHVFPSTLFSEQNLHDRFDAARKDLEWFFYTKDLKSFIIAEMDKSNTILMSFQKRKELNKIEEEIFNKLK